MILTYHALTRAVLLSPDLAMRTDVHRLRYMSDSCENLVATARAYPAAIPSIETASVQIHERQIAVDVKTVYAVLKEIIVWLSI